MAPTRCKLSILTITHNSSSVITACLESIPSACPEIDYEIIVVDNNSSDNSADLVSNVCPDATVLRNSVNSGFAAACNQAAAVARGEYLLFLNPDVVVDASAITQMISAYEELSRPGAVSGRMRFPDGSFQSTCRRFPTPGNLLFSRQSLFQRFRKNNTTNYSYGDSDTLLPVEAVAGTMLMIKRELFTKFGGFDKRFFLYMEDTDLCLRLNRSGYINYFVPSAGGMHAWGTGSTASAWRRRRHHHNSMWKYFLKHYPNSFSLIILPLLLIMNLLLLTVSDLITGSRSSHQ